jgi:elongation factor P--(R)-beta-lysine ligase
MDALDQHQPGDERRSARDDFGPTAEWSTLCWRAEMLFAVRQFFRQRHYVEVETPLLSHDTTVDAWLDPFVTGWQPDPRQWRSPSEWGYLQTSPEFAMKRLMTAGATAIFQLGKAFRNGELGRRHNPEFTMLEWYRRGDNLAEQMQFTEQFVMAAWQAGLATRPANGSVNEPLPTVPKTPFERLTYNEAFRRHTGLPALQATMAELQQLASSRQLVAPPGLAANDRDGWLNFLLAELVEPHLGHDRLVFLHDYPASQAALATTRTTSEGFEVAHRFELYCRGIELCNGYHELLDAQVLSQRSERQNAIRVAEGARPLPVQSRLLTAMQAGLPEMSGVALGFDRLLMSIWGTEQIADVIAFPWSRA